MVLNFPAKEVINSVYVPYYVRGPLHYESTPFQIY